MTTKNNTFNEYEFDVRINLRRKVDRYSSDVLVAFTQTHEAPFSNDDAARIELARVVNEALGRADQIVETRIDFEDTVKRLTSGDTIEVDEY